MSAPIIFLDIDGVLINRKSFMGSEGKKCSGLRARPDPDCVARLNRITEATGAKLVLSSSWRSTHDTHKGNLKENRKLLLRFGVQGELIGYTERLEYKEGSIFIAKQRGDEIQHWLDKNECDSRFLIIDDDSDMGPLLLHLIQTNFEIGLTDELAEQAIRRLS